MVWGILKWQNQLRITFALYIVMGVAVGLYIAWCGAILMSDRRAFATFYAVRVKDRVGFGIRGRAGVGVWVGVRVGCSRPSFGVSVSLGEVPLPV